MTSRREFLKAGSVGLVGAGLPGWAKASGWATPFLGSGGSADTLTVAIMGVNSRGGALAQGFANAENCVIKTICDVDSRAADRAAAEVEAAGFARPGTTDDVRRVLDDPDIDALVVAAPDHWHAPAALMALDAGKHVYLEKPCSQNPREGEVLVAKQANSGLLIQMGNQQRSAPESIEIISKIRDGLIGRPYFGRAWYANSRGSIGHGSPAPVPDWLNYELWQGPAPRTAYRDNVVHYNWHWFKRWGTGEICNNGTHEIDVCRWALDVQMPERVQSTGGRYHFKDDWEFFDTQLASFEFANNTQIVWDGRSCNGQPLYGRGRGSAIHGTEGTVIVDRDGYVAYDLGGRETERRLRSDGIDALDTRGGDRLTDFHIHNFLESVRGKDTLNAPIADARNSQLLCHVGNIAQFEHAVIEMNPEDGRPRDQQHLTHWGRDYEPGWEIE
ncbi:MAG: putative dehydrogenase [Rhodothermales bacterium]|jgi:predicted dehydrogenase